MKGTKCGRSVTFGTCLHKWLSLGITKNIMRQAKECKSAPLTPAPEISPEERRKGAIKDRNDREIALIAESITATIDTVKAMKLQAQADEAAQAALAQRMVQPDKETQDLLHTLTIMQQNLVAAVSCRDREQDIAANGIKPTRKMTFPLTHTVEYHPTRYAPKAQNAQE